MPSLRSHEGYLLIDHRNSPGLTEKALVSAGMISAGLPADAGRGVYESATYTCSHCNRVVVINPLRTRERAYCPKCDHRICDHCEAVRVASAGECRSMKQIAEEIQNAASRGESVSKILIP